MLLTLLQKFAKKKKTSNASLTVPYPVKKISDSIACTKYWLTRSLSRAMSFYLFTLNVQRHLRTLMLIFKEFKDQTRKLFGGDPNLKKWLLHQRIFFFSWRIIDSSSKYFFLAYVVSGFKTQEFYKTILKETKVLIKRSLWAIKIRSDWYVRKEG